jgi:pimeloyl-ACP methyl ester carboxylesterase
MTSEALTLTIDGEDLACLRTDGGDERAIVMVHGFTGDRHEHGMFDAAAEQFAASGYTVYRFDCRGWGASSGDTTDFSLDTEVADLEQVFTHADDRFDTVAAVGLSMGAYVVLASQIPACAYACWSPALNLSSLAEDQLLDHRSWSDIPDTVTVDLWDDTYRFSRQFLMDLQDADPTAVLQENTVPTLFIHGRHDDTVPLASTVDALDTNGSTSQLTVLDGDHLFAPEHEEAYEETVSWFDRHCGGAS